MTKTDLLKHLRNLGACAESLAYIESAVGSPEEIYAAVERSEWLEWLFDKCDLRSEAYEEAYDEAIAPAERAYREAISTARRAYAEAYEEAIAPARRAYDEAIYTAERAYDEAIYTAERAYDEAIAHAVRAYAEAIAPARRACCVTLRAAVPWATVQAALTARGAP